MMVPRDEFVSEHLIEDLVRERWRERRCNCMNERPRQGRERGNPAHPALRCAGSRLRSGLG